jgi:hypothetical protein
LLCLCKNPRACAQLQHQGVWLMAQGALIIVVSLVFLWGRYHHARRGTPTKAA